MIKGMTRCFLLFRTIIIILFTVGAFDVARPDPDKYDQAMIWEQLKSENELLNGGARL